MKRALIVTGGSLETEFCLRYTDRYRFDYKIAVDSGIHFFYETGKKPDLMIGDFDSACEEELFFFEHQEGIAWIRLNPHKDDTDTEAAVRWAISNGYEEIHVLGGTGSRLDHTMGNIGLLGIGLKEGVRILMIDPYNRIRMIKDPCSILKEEQYGKYVSLIPVTGKVTGITLTGMKYPLTDYTMKAYGSIGISNEIVDTEGKICFTDGVLLVFETK